jgi:glycosyltransferase involved in cell wall biosynthesis
MHVYGGAELLIVKLANYMTKKGIDNALLTTSIPLEMQKDLAKTNIIIQEKPKMLIDILNTSEIIALHKGLHNNLNNFDVINVHNYPAELSVFPYHKSFVWMCNEPLAYLILQRKLSRTSRIENEILLAFEKFVVRNYIKNVVVADEFNAERFDRIYGFKPEIINYGIDYEFFSKRDRHKLLNDFNSHNSFIVLQVGWIQPFKNQMESVKTIEKLKERIPNIKLMLVGQREREYGMLLEEYIKKKRLEQNVIFTGHLGRGQVRDLYHACDVLLHPIKSQGGWLAPFEALCAKKPIVVSPEMTASEIIKREKIGVVTDDFAGVIWDMYNNQDKYNKMEERGQVWVRENLSWDKFCEKTVEFFYRVVGR